MAGLNLEVGNIVECWNNPDRIINEDASGYGRGWENGKVFKIGRISWGTPKSIAWPEGKDQMGVYTDCLKLKGDNMVNDLKNYFSKNKDIFYTLGAVLIIDYFLFGGAMRKKVQDVVENMLNNVSKKVSAAE